MPKYHNIETIPANVFFTILESKNYQLLKPKPKEKDLEAVFMSIYDDYFVKSNNQQANEFLRLRNEISFLEYKKAVIKQTLAFTYYNKTTKQMRLDILKALKEGCDIDIDPNLPFVDEVERVLTIEIGILENDLNFAKLAFDELIKEAKKKEFDYYKSVAELSKAIDMQIRPQMSLAEYIGYEKVAEEIIKSKKK
jgi:hypothetical protein